MYRIIRMDTFYKQLPDTDGVYDESVVWISAVIADPYDPDSRFLTAEASYEPETDMADNALSLITALVATEPTLSFDAYLTTLL